MRLIPIVLIVLGLLLLGKGITGMVLGGSCCFGDACEDLCDAAEPHLEAPSHIAPSIFGSILLLLGIVFIAKELA